MKVFGVALSAVILALSFSAEAQQPKKVFRIGFLSALSPKPGNVNVDAFREALRALGWVEGQDIAIEYRWANAKPSITIYDDEGEGLWVTIRI